VPSGSACLLVSQGKLRGAPPPLYRGGMCDLNPVESRNIVAALNEISGLAQKVGTHATSITETDYMDHEGLGEVLAMLNERVASAHQWVTAKPLEHADTAQAGN
jgi:hypothetical protein